MFLALILILHTIGLFYCYRLGRKKGEAKGRREAAAKFYSSKEFEIGNKIVNICNETGASFGGIELGLRHRGQPYAERPHFDLPDSKNINKVGDELQKRQNKYRSEKTGNGLDRLTREQLIEMLGEAEQKENFEFCADLKRELNERVK